MTGSHILSEYYDILMSSLPYKSDILLDFFSEESSIFTKIDFSGFIPVFLNKSVQKKPMPYKRLSQTQGEQFKQN